MPESWVYFIQAEGGGPIKVGIARDVRERMRKLQMGNWVRLRVLAIAPGGTQEERALHEQFASSRVRGEWFEDTASLRRWMSDHAEAWVCSRDEARKRTRDSIARSADERRLGKARHNAAAPWRSAFATALQQAKIARDSRRRACR